MSENFTFNPSVWSETVRAYMPQKNLFLSLAFRYYGLSESVGTTMQFPFFKLVNGAVREYSADESVIPYNLDNGSFELTVKEYAMGVAITDTDKMNLVSLSAGSSMGPNALQSVVSDWETNAQMQLAYKYGVNIDGLIVNLLQQPGNYTQGFTASSSADTFSNSVLNYARSQAFLDRGDEAIYCVCHPFQFNDFVSSVGGLNAFQFNAIRQDILDTGYFRGQFNGINFFVYNKVPSVAPIGGAPAYTAYLFKPYAYGVGFKMSPKVAYSRDVPGRRDVYTSTAWYNPISLHKRISDDDARICAITTTVKVAP